MRRLPLVGLLVLLAACSNKKGSLEHDQVTTLTTPTSVTVTSDALGGAAPTVPTKYTCDGANTSFPLQWAPGAPITIDTWTLRIDDPDAPGGGFVHWVVDTIPASTTRSDEGGAPSGGSVKTAYRGPCPPKGSSPHHYVITVSGISGGRTVARGTLTATYQRR